MNKKFYRVGNIVGGLPDPEIIVNITKFDLEFKGGRGCLQGSEYPVPVTGSILLKCGFRINEAVPGAYYLLLENITPAGVKAARMHWIGGNLFLETMIGQAQLWDQSVRGQLELYHLQNLYIDLTGLELQVDL